jgi:SAM-dependent methyltransferase
MCSKILASRLTPTLRSRLLPAEIFIDFQSDSSSYLGTSGTDKRSLLLTWSVIPPSSCLSYSDYLPQHAHAAENLLPYLKPGARVLDVGSGSGYVTAIFHHLVSEDGAPGHVVGIDKLSSLVHMSEENLRKDGLGEALKSGSIKLIEGDGKIGRYFLTFFLSASF